ncbi:MAG: 5-formyltetrahydrofolate cyclo-ligase [Collimonas fungivorans]|uniref:5-formyltetrahydrofolate cyclo-ligase n=1 Tax=Collimonas fungivorans TaxID=158899 RepID=UPI0026EABA84|nr:5-formyltetrahydrofolate cyclo-ligase [Collimonas fungivorans]MDB5766826.1 5-formyltetrahydrofolate cyclo-ligase [Collimonas fungivorans]
MTSSIACDARDATPGPDKAQLRRTLLTTRQAIDPAHRHDWDAELGKRVIAWATGWGLAHPDGTLGVYWPIRGEPDLQPAYAELAARGMRLALPVVIDVDSPLRFVSWSPGEAMVKDSFGVAIPASYVTVIPQALLIPCVGFNRNKIRLGYGGGFYDRTLAPLARPQTVGIAYSCALAEFDGAAHDIALDAVITEAANL